VSYTICFIILLLIIIITIASLIGIRPYKVLSKSMEPIIKTGSICFVDMNYQYNDIKKDDIIAFNTSTNTMVIHRVIAITNEGFETKGDNNDNPDKIYVTEKNFQGKIIFYIPYVGYFLLCITNPITIILLAIIIIISIFIKCMSNCFKENT